MPRLLGRDTSRLALPTFWASRETPSGISPKDRPKPIGQETGMKTGLEDSGTYFRTNRIHDSISNYLIGIF